MDLGLTGRAALVAGASRGLGFAVADELAAEGMRLMICARDGAALEDAAADLRRRHGVDVVAVSTDLSDAFQVRRLTTRALAEFGTVDVLVTNAGGPPAGPFEQHDDAAWDAAVRQNLLSVIELVRGVLPGMKAAGWGRIINVTSIAVKQPVDNLILSNSVRAAVTGFSRTLANEVAAQGITVNCVMPGYTRTRRVEELAARNASLHGTTAEQETDAWERAIPAGRLGEPREFGAMVAFLASDRASYTTGASIPVDGGWIRALV